MVLSLHVIFSPKGETLTRLNFTLPEEGGSIGSDPNNTIVLPDSSFKVIPMHAVIKKERDKYFIKDMSQSGIYINGSEKKLGYYNELLLNDGDTLDIAGYRLLISCFSSKKNISFSQDAATENSNMNMDIKHIDPFPSNNALGLDVYDDPFESFDESNLNKDNPLNTVGQYAQMRQDPHHIHEVAYNNKESEKKCMTQSAFVAVDTKELDPFTGLIEEAPLQTVQSLSNRIEPVYSPQTFPVERPEVVNGRGTLMPMHQVLQTECRSHSSVMEIADIEVMKAKIEGAMQRFLDELSPEYLEAMFNDCHIGWRKLKEKDLWGLYRAHFFRMMNSNEFQRKFWAYFCDQ
ncbi:FHA domain-containing protein [uncultured Shewanella sp.]|uniref:FHA domain-containing protein n=1 Tax=uncultured Shewanella sp. TaxID=173975 RepID=UPI00262C9E57|nr:FHA domain-containing protein [uncultured Shewanella sp.]